MPRKEYDWQIGDDPPRIDLHSLAKHRVYEEYLTHYIRVLNTNPKIPVFRVTIVDGFAGGGAYTNPRDNSLYPGSPSRLVKAAEAGVAAVNVKREQEGIRTPLTLQAEYFFIEKKESNHKYLKRFMSKEGFGRRFENDIFPIQGAFTERLDKIIRHITKRGRNRHCLFFLDQYGYGEVPFSDIRAIFSQLPNAEIILTFAVDALINYMSDDPRYLKALQCAELNQVLDIPRLLKEKEDNKDWRLVVQLLLHRAIQSLSGTRYYTPFFIRSNESHRSFWLVHLSNHPKARDVMTELHWRLKNHFVHYGGSGLWMFGYDPMNDQRIVSQPDILGGLEHFFDETANTETRKSLREQLPELVYRYPDGIPSQGLYALVANTTPATSKHIKETAIFLLQANELEILGPNGKPRSKRIKEIQKDDLLCIRQKTLSLGGYNLLDI
uniref:Three-Cys-motif partner protein n=1 Tax=Candidatus Kentrum sp. TC TaxID=2126339 RepID=A0A451A3X2_9GAMM|nr:MAG: three-Cys-motif partner protein [Candidatus Kentron sp. TC]